MDESIVKHLEQPAKVLRLSEAIRIGARIRPQTALYCFKNGGSCVWGAAYEGMGGEYREKMKFSEMNPIISTARYVDANEAYRSKYGHASWWHNDNGVAREVIADRLEALGY